MICKLIKKIYLILFQDKSELIEMIYEQNDYIDALHKSHGVLVEDNNRLRSLLNFRQGCHGSEIKKARKQLERLYKVS